MFIIHAIFDHLCSLPTKQSWDCLVYVTIFPTTLSHLCSSYARVFRPYYVYSLISSLGFETFSFCSIRSNFGSFLPCPNASTVFRRVRKIAKSDCYLRHVCLSVRPPACMELFGSHWSDFH